MHSVSSKTLDQTRERVALEQHTFCPVQSRRCRCHRRRSCCGRWSHRSRARRSDFPHHNMSRASTQEGRSSERVSSEWTSECSGSQRACSLASFMFAAPQSHARKGAIYSRQRRQSAGAAIRAAPLCEGPRMAVRARSTRQSINACIKGLTHSSVLRTWPSGNMHSQVAKRRHGTPRHGCFPLASAGASERPTQCSQVDTTQS